VTSLRLEPTGVFRASGQYSRVPATVTELLQHLVRIPSVNPDNDPGTAATGEAAIADFLAGHLTGLGATVTLEEILPGRPNLIARFAPLDGRPRVLLGPHLDTVGVAGMTIDPFEAAIRDGRLYGRGASDTKGPMAAMLWGLQQNREHLAGAPVAVDFVAFMAEESGQWGSKDFARRHAADYQFGVVGEPTGLDIVHTTKGSLWATLVAHGRAVHSSMPERGDNAILKLARALAAVDDQFKQLAPRYAHPVLGLPTLNVGTIRGGSRPNIVPDFASAELDIRITPGLAAAGGALALLESILTDLPVAISNPHENPPMETPADHPGVRWLQRTRAASRAVGAPWFSDAAHLSAAGLPSVCLGPGTIQQAHTADEFISLADLDAGAEFFTRAIAGLVSGGL
jgi:acetylornithine deacetylase/succinyl-diaminopimelate desuccinylase-like protein